MAKYYIDILDDHPKIILEKSPESLSGYAIRVCDLNDVRSVAGFGKLFFPNVDARIIRNFSDLPPLSLKEFAVTTNNLEEILLGGTFYYLAKNFGRSTHPQAISRLLTGVVSKTLRYCSKCIDKYQYYQLIWRFSLIEGCIEHGCYLLDKCGNCGEPIPLLYSPLKLGVCPSCNFEIKKRLSPS